MMNICRPRSMRQNTAGDKFKGLTKNKGTARTRSLNRVEPGVVELDIVAVRQLVQHADRQHWGCYLRVCRENLDAVTLNGAGIIFALLLSPLSLLLSSPHLYPTNWEKLQNNAQNV